jgi:hypothetical protein
MQPGVATMNGAERHSLPQAARRAAPEGAGNRTLGLSFPHSSTLKGVEARATSEKTAPACPPVALINLALLRSINLRLISTENSDDWLPARKERLAAHPGSALEPLREKL